MKRQPVLYGQSVDVANLDAAARDFIRQQRVHHAARFPHDDRADAVAARHADDDFVHRRKVLRLRAALHLLGARDLLGQQRPELLDRAVDRLIHCSPHSFV